MDTLCTYKYSAMFLTETWIELNGDDLAMKSSTPKGYSYIHQSRASGKRGGGVGIIHHDGIKCTDITDESKTYSSFELISSRLTLNGESVRFYLIYRPLPSTTNNISKSQFVPDFADFLEYIVLQPGQFYILGDFNIPWDIPTNHERKHLASVLASFGLVQTVQDRTHSHGHTLDYIIAKAEETRITCHGIGELVSDHYLVYANLQFPKPKFKVKEVTYRKISAIDSQSFSKDIINAGLQPSTNDSITDAMERYSCAYVSFLTNMRHTKNKNHNRSTKGNLVQRFDQRCKTQKKCRSEHKICTKRKAPFKLNHDKSAQAYQSISADLTNIQHDRNAFVQCLNNAKETYFMN